MLQNKNILEEKEEENLQIEEDDEEEEEEENNSHIELAFIENEKNILFQQRNWKEWDGGRIGGKPVWLNRKVIPDSNSLKCLNCENQLIFLLQIYCPLDEPESAFHRCLYLFCCRNADCIQKGSILCLRSQLSKINEFYPAEPDPNDTTILTESDNIPLCSVCGCLGSHRCGKCHQENYCSRTHQKLDWSRHKPICNTITSSSSTTSNEQLNNTIISNNLLFPSYSLVIEGENLDDNDSNTKISTQEDISKLSENNSGGEIDGTLAINNQSSLSDPLYVKFLTRIAVGGTDQVIRYYCRELAHKTSEELTPGTQINQNNSNHKSSLPLPVSSTGYPQIDLIPNCENCGGKRTFEFQVMPQLLHYLQVDSQTTLGTISTSKDVFQNFTYQDIDWGSLDVFTCSNSCTPVSSNHYIKEYVWRQPPPLEKVELDSFKEENSLEN